MASVADRPLELPTSKAQCQKMLQELGHHGLKIDAIDQGDTWLGIAPRIYVLTRPQWVSADTSGQANWRRVARTIVFDTEDDKVRVRVLDGWVVN